MAEQVWTLWICSTDHVPFASGFSDDEFDYATESGCPACGGSIRKIQVVASEEAK